MILDTNALSAFFVGEPEITRILSSVDAVRLPVVVLGEYRFGLHGSVLGKKLESILHTFVESCEVLPILETTAVHYANIRHGLKSRGTPIPENDIWIAALAEEHKQPILSRDLHFDRIPSIKRVSF